MSELFIRSIDFSSLDSQYCVQALIMLEGKLTRARARAVPGAPLWSALGQEIESVQALRNRFSFIGGSNESTQAQSGA
nr:MAG: hypothetical protein [Microvirus sp.]